MKKQQKRYFTLLCLLFIISFQALASSGGPLKPEQAAYDVNYYALDLNIDHVGQIIYGSLLCRVEVLEVMDSLLLDLDDPFLVSSVLFQLNDGAFSEVGFQHADELLNINIPESIAIGDMISVEVFYGGPPRIATNPPWGVGFVWDTTPDGDPWLAVACEDQGGDIWWPCKDHPSDEPDSMNMSFTVANPLMCVSNGQYLGSDDNGDNTSTFHWFISTPINNYNVTFYAAEFELIEEAYESSIGNDIPFMFWVLPEFHSTALDYMDVFQQEFDFLEEICGPFPFGTDKHGWAHAPYWGMEHQTIIAYGHNFTTNNWGFDYIHYHELAHEWWGNLITAEDWADVWIHEGLATYTEALYVEHLTGMEDYFQFMREHRPGNNHSYPLAPYEEMTASEAFDNLNPYNRGASVMHTMRYYLGDEVFFELLKRWAYPDPDDLDNTHGRLCRILNTEDLKLQAEEVTGRDMDLFFEVFFREASYPILQVEREYNQTLFTWETENSVLLDLNIPILIDEVEYTVEMVDGQGSIAMDFTQSLDIDPNKWILMAHPSIIINIDEDHYMGLDNGLEQNYPNPFSQSTLIKYSLNQEQKVTIKLYDMLGNKIKTLLQEHKSPGIYELVFEAQDLPKGSYFYRLETGNFVETQRLLKY